MTEVLRPSGESDGHPFYSSPDGYPLKRSSVSCSSFLAGSASLFSKDRSSPPSPPHSQSPYSSYSVPPPNSKIGYHSFTDLTRSDPLPPTPASSVSLEDEEDRDDNDIAFPSYDDAIFSSPSVQQEELVIDTIPQESDDIDITASTSISDSDFEVPSLALTTPPVVDDTAIKPDPAHHVDYLSHNWREEDIWASWRLVVSKRNMIPTSARLENASWRTWAKAKYRLDTISPESLNWLKESDVTWLYGPLQPAISRPITHDAPDPSPDYMSCSKSRTTKKPILKKRTVSEVMLQRSLSANSLVKQAAASVQAQQCGPQTRSIFIRGISETRSRLLAQSQPASRDSDCLSDISTDSSITTPNEGRKHIRFDDKVEQCIAVECKTLDIYEDTDTYDNGGSSDSDDGVLTMQQSPNRRWNVVRPSLAHSARIPTKSIEKLPDTTLKYKSDSPGSRKNSTNSFTSSFWDTNKITPSASQETLRPLNPSCNFLMASDDEDDGDTERAWRPPVLQSSSPSIDGGVPNTFDVGDDVPPNMRRTGSGMFMPYDDDDEEIATEGGLFTRVSDTFNTARDIAHVIWNVGWRK